MTVQNGEAVIRAAYERYARGELDQMLDLIDPDLEWVYLDPGLPDRERQTCRGRDELKAALRGQADRGLTSHLQEIRPAADDRVMVVVHTPGADAHRLRAADDRNYDVFTVREGRITAIHACRDRAEPLTIAGLT